MDNVTNDIDAKLYESLNEAPANGSIQIPLSIIAINEGILKNANAAALNLFGAKNLDEVIEKPFKNYIEAQYYDVIQQYITCLDEGSHLFEYSFEITGLHKEKSHLELSLIHIADKKKSAYTLFFQDITLRKRKVFFDQTLSNIEKVIHTSFNNHDIARTAMEMAAIATNCDSAAVSFVRKDVWEVIHAYKFSPDITGLFVPYQEEPHAILALQKKEIQLIEDTSSDYRVINERMKSWGIKSVVVVPLYTKHKDIGAIFFNYHEKKVFSSEKVYFLNRFSTALSLSLENSDLFDHLNLEIANKEKNEKKLVRLNNTLLALSHSSQLMMFAKSEKDFISKICSIIIKETNQMLAWVGFIDHNEIKPFIWKGDAENYIQSLKVQIHDGPYSQGPTGLSIRTKTPVSCTVYDPSFKPWRENALKNGITSSISLPLLHADEVYGVMNIYSRETEAFTPDVILFLSEIAKYLSQGILAIRLRNAKQTAERNLKESEERFRMLAEKSNALICELNEYDKILFTNEKFRAAFGTLPDLTSTRATNASSEVEIFLCNQRNQASESEYEWKLQDKEGNWRWFRCHKNVYTTSSNEVLHNIIMFDITDIKQVEDQLKKNATELKELNATKDKFFGIIAHDLRNPFTSLMGASEILAKETRKIEYDSIQTLAKIINDSSNRGYALLQNLLDWARSQTGNLTFNPEDIDLIELINECKDYLLSSATHKNQKIHLNSSAKIKIRADKNMINTVLRNVIYNAIKFTPMGGDIYVSASASERTATIVVEDTGIGIPDDDCSKLFRIDEKITRPGTNREQGTGLGLILCKEFVEKHDGKIWAESEPGKGSKFFFTLPITYLSNF